MKVQIKTPKYLYNRKLENHFKLYSVTTSEGNELMCEFDNGVFEISDPSEIRYKKNGEFTWCRNSTRQEFNNARREFLQGILYAEDWVKPLKNGNLRLGDIIDIFIERPNVCDLIYEDCIVAKLGLYPAIKHKGELIDIFDLIPEHGNLNIRRERCKKRERKKVFKKAEPTQQLELINKFKKNRKRKIIFNI